jgi:hypothetical protein
MTLLLSLGKFGNPNRLTTSAVLRVKDLVQSQIQGRLSSLLFKENGMTACSFAPVPPNLEDFGSLPLI